MYPTKHIWRSIELRETDTSAKELPLFFTTSHGSEIRDDQSSRKLSTRAFFHIRLCLRAMQIIHRTLSYQLTCVIKWEIVFPPITKNKH